MTFNTNLVTDEQIISILGKAIASRTLLEVLLTYHTDDPLLSILKDNLTSIEYEVKGLINATRSIQVNYSETGDSENAKGNERILSTG